MLKGVILGGHIMPLIVELNKPQSMYLQPNLLSAALHSSATSQLLKEHMKNTLTKDAANL